MPSCRFCKIIGLPLQPPVLRSSGGFCSIHGCDLSCSISCGGVTNGEQGGSHSPTLFGRLVAARFEQLTQTWQLQGEHPAFVAATLSLWALWFIDDAILVYQTVAQALRLLPQVVSMLVWGSASMLPSLAFWGAPFHALCLAAWRRSLWWRPPSI